MNGNREEMACQVCLTPLNTLDGTYIHPIHHDHDGHQPVPVPVRTLDTISRTCDFCGDDHPMWTLTGAPVAVVAVGLDLVNDYGQTWAACVPCEADLAHGRTGKVVDRALRHLGVSGHPAARERISALHQAFLDQRRPGRVLITTTAWPASPLKPRDLPKVRDRLAAFYRSPDHDLPDPLGINHHRHALADSLDRSRLYWIDNDFTDLAEHAATQLPTVTISGDLAPGDDGLLVWARPVTSRSIAAASWTCHGDTGHLITYRSIGAGLDGPPLQRLRDDIGWLAPVTASPTHRDQAHDHGHPTAALLATWLLIAQKATQATPADIDPAVRKTYARKNRPLPDVRIVRIHAPSRTADEPARPSASHGTRRAYTHRVWVTGHWRNQAYGPGRALRRPVYIHPTLRGPDDAPIKLSTTVRMLISRTTPPDDSKP